MADEGWVKTRKAPQSAEIKESQMADVTEKWEDNIPGNVTIGGQTVSFYVDK